MMARSGVMGVVVASVASQQVSRTIGQLRELVHTLAQTQTQAMSSSGIGVDGCAAQFGETHCSLRLYAQTCGMFSFEASTQQF